MDDIRENKSDIQTDIRMTYGWHAVRKKNKVIVFKAF